MIKQQMERNLQTQSGTLTITAEPGNLSELIALATELQYRSNVQTEGTIDRLPDAPPPVGGQD